MTSSPADQRSVTAKYTSPGGNQTFNLPLTAPCTNSSTASRTKYLNELRSSTKQLQADVNKFLTEKMEEDKKRDATSLQNQGKAKKNEELEEQNYGEEVVEDD